MVLEEVFMQGVPGRCVWSKAFKLETDDIQTGYDVYQLRTSDDFTKVWFNENNVADLMTRFASQDSNQVASFLARLAQ